MTRRETIPQDVQDKYEELTLHLIRNGWQRYSSDAILHRIRWHFQVERGLRDFKCNNNWTAPLARWFMRKYPQHQGFFETREKRRETHASG